MRLSSRAAALVAGSLTLALLAGCSSGKRTTSSSTAAPATSGTTGTTTPTGALPSGSGAAPSPASSAGGNTTSGSAASGATPGGFAGGTGVFTDASHLLPASAERDYGADAGDLDGDGDVDIVIAVNGGPSRVLFNEGAAGFVERPGAFPTLTMEATDVRLIDADGDGDYDLMFSANFEPVRLFLNDGAGVFTLAAEILQGNDAYAYKLAIGDADGDGDSDVFLSRAGQATPSRGQNVLLLNGGSGDFAVAPAGSVPAKADDSLDATFFDVDGDGDLDLFVANFGGTHTLLLNDGTGRFTDATATLLPASLSSYGTAVAAADLDGDGAMDLFVANEGAPSGGQPPAGEPNSLLLWRATQFEDAANQVPQHSEASFALRLIDVDADGYLDVFCSNLRAGQRLYMNRGGVLSDGTANLPAVAATPADSLGLTVGDFNGDLAPDVLFLRRGQTPLLFLNTP